jgi:hypothetical protein
MPRFQPWFGPIFGSPLLHAAIDRVCIQMLLKCRPSVIADCNARSKRTNNPQDMPIYSESGSMIADRLHEL